MAFNEEATYNPFRYSVISLEVAAESPLKNKYEKACNLFFLGLLSPRVLSQVLEAKGTGEVKPFILGIIDELQSKELNEEHILNIYLPSGYKAGDTIAYPVTYLLDGSADEDFIHVAGIYQFNNFDWIDRVLKSIVVGIATVNRRRDFTFPSNVIAEKERYPESGHSNNFIRFIEKELQPFIASKYGGKGLITIIGQSLGSLLATAILFKKPELF